MNYKYRVEGRVEKAFILRGMHFRIGGTIETAILESELAFVKERCELDKVEGLTAPSQPILSNSKVPKKEAKNELPKQPSSTASKGKVATKVSVVKP